MNDTSNRLEHRFTVRVWFEPATGSGGQWRGSVEHVSTGQRLYFATLGDLTDFIALRMNQPPAATERAQ